MTVLGAGLMGHGIAQVCAQTAGYEVTLLDVKQEFVDRGMSMIKDSLAKFVAKGGLEKSKADEILSRIHPTLDLKAAVEGRSSSSRPPPRTPSSSSTSTARSRSTCRPARYSPPTRPPSA